MLHMAEVVPAADARNLQQFLTHSKWEAMPVMDQVAQEANVVLGDAREACLLLDEVRPRFRSSSSPQPLLLTAPLHMRQRWCKRTAAAAIIAMSM